MSTTSFPGSFCCFSPLFEIKSPTYWPNITSMLIITITRVEKMEPLLLKEDTPVGTLVANIVASDPDSNSDLRWWCQDLISCQNSKNFLVLTLKCNWQMKIRPKMSSYDLTIRYIWWKYLMQMDTTPKTSKKYQITEKFKLAHKVRGNGFPGSRLTLKPQKLWQRLVARWFLLLTGFTLDFCSD